MSRSFLSILKEQWVLIWINIQVKWRNLVEYFHVIARYYFNSAAFFKIDTALLSSYLFANPFKISKEFLIRRGEENIYTFGETPLTTLEVIARRCSLSKRDVVFELGCGRGRTCFWFHQFIGCTVVGVDFVPAFIHKAQNIAERFHIPSVSFRLEDLFKTDLSGATVIYLYGTCYSDEEISLLIDRFRQLPKGSKIITISYSLLEYQPAAPFIITQQFEVKFTWGVADVYLQIKQS